jgi:thiamine-phosphate pyrophosphorylase
VSALDVRLYLVTGPVGPGRQLVDVVCEAVAGGVTCVQLREKETTGTAALAARAGALVEAVPGVPVIVDDDPWAAVAAGAAGVHVGVHDLPPHRAREVVGQHRVVGWSVEDLAQLERREDVMACDYVAVSPVWATPTKTDTAPALGLAGVRAVREAVPRGMRVVGIGGVSAGNAADVVAAGADGVAVVSALCGADDPREAAAGLRRAVEGWRP